MFETWFSNHLEYLSDEWLLGVDRNDNKAVLQRKLSGISYVPSSHTDSIGSIISA